MLAWVNPAWAGFTVSPNPLTITATQGQADFPVVVTVTNTGNAVAVLTYDDSFDSFKSVTPSPAQLTLAAGASGTFTLTASVSNPWNCTGGCPMAAGTYTSSATITDGTTVLTLPITLTVTAPQATPPDKVMGVGVAVSQSVALNWDAEVGVSGYRVYQSSISGQYGSPVQSVTTNAATVGGLSVGTYFFTVTAFNGSGESLKSNEVSITLR